MDWTTVMGGRKAVAGEDGATPKNPLGGYVPMLGTWLIEMALLFDWCDQRRRKKLEWPDIFEDGDFLALVGIPSAETLTEEGVEPSASRSRDILKKRHAELAKAPPPENPLLFRNIDTLGDLLGLGEVDRSIVAFAASFRVFQKFTEAISPRNQKTSSQMLCTLLSRLTGFTESEVRASLADDGVLATSGIVKIDRRIIDLENKVLLLDGLSTFILAPNLTTDDLVSRFLRRSAPPRFKTADFPHLASDTEVLHNYLSKTVAGKVEGVNVLLHGKPGVGKTEYAKALAAEAGADLYETATDDEDGDPLRGEARLRAFHFCQSLLSKAPNAILLLDEIEDVFPDDGAMTLSKMFGGNGGPSKAAAGKAWINKLMEGNPVPAIWVGNRVEHVDPAYLRRFDYSIRFAVPPSSVRLGIAKHHFERIAPPDGWLEKIASDGEMTPGQFDRAAKVASLIASEGGVEAVRIAERVLDKSAMLLCQRRSGGKMSSDTGYDLTFVNADADIPAIVAGLARRGKGTFCFHGDPGTGKTALARHIADLIGKPLVVRRASDILDKYVGEAEKNIAEMFAEAKEQGAVLLLDEADSFLRDRTSAEHSWEVSQVNELLTRMEAYDGVFICTTNLMDALDPASLRRFDFKVRFNPLTPDQRCEMFRRELVRLGCREEVDPTFEDRVRTLEGLTPGDFAVAARQFQLWDVPATPEKLHEQLKAECAQKRGGGISRRIGFGG